MEKKIRFGMIGCGAVTEIKSGPAYQNTQGIELVGVTRRDLTKAHEYAHRHNVKQVFASASDLINSADIDAVYIATPPDSHLALALQVAAAGKPCCIEKPLAPTLLESQQIVDAFKAASVPLFVAYYRRSLPRFNKIKQLIDKGAIGQVRHVSWHLSKPPSELDLSEEYNWRTDSNIARGGYFDDLASHGLDLIAYLLGEYKYVQGFATNQQGLYTAFDAVTASWLHHNGVTGSASWNFASRSRHDHVTVYGSKGELSFSIFDEQAITLNNEQGKEQFIIENPKHIQQYHVENMAHSLLNVSEHPSTGESALHTSWVMEQILIDTVASHQKT
ncbi:MAG: Gfo/Idh/MocA family protein [Pseudoalteromonas sp.]|uniref:Gfo/Idh/MocA family protein n=1 Tax=Pseudoalteromonas TaxID=53246 RepID=UPI003F94419E